MRSNKLSAETLSPDKVNWKFYTMSVVGNTKPKQQKDVVIKGKPTIKELDSSQEKENMDVLHVAEQWWSSLRDFRERRRRVRDYLNGDQWKDKIIDPENENEYITEELNIIRQGKIPLKQNIMSQLHNNIVGRFRSNQLKPIVISRDKINAEQSEMLTNALQHAHNVNSAKELDANNFKEFLKSGMPICKIGYKYFKERNLEDAWIQNVNPNRFFFNTDITDIRHTDLRMVGEVHDLTIDELISVFAKNSADAELIKSWYAGYGKDIHGIMDSNGLSTKRYDNVDFFIPSDTTKCRLIEVWLLKAEWRTYVHDYLNGQYYITKLTPEQVNIENQMRIEKAVANGVAPEDVPLKYATPKYEQFWYVKFLTPNGQCLYEGETTYKHESHPYAFVTYPLVDGVVRGMFEEIIDQQRYINRLITMMDFMIGASAKGVLLVPEDSIPDDMDLDDIAEEWSRYNGVIKIKAKPGMQLPQQIVSRGTSVGVGEMLQLQMKLMQEISGVNYAIQGQKAGSSTPSSLYAQEAENSAVNSKDVMDTFTYFLKQRDTKLLKVIHQYYDEKRMLLVGNTSYAAVAREWNPDKVADLDTEVEISQTIDTPVFRQVTDEILLDMMKNQLIDIETYLEHSNMPFAKSLLDTIKKKQAAMQGAMQGQMQGDLPQQAGEQPANVDPKVMEMAQRMMKQPEQAA